MARQTGYGFANPEAWWVEQRPCLDQAVAELAPADRATANKALATLPPAAPAATPERPIEAASTYAIDGWRFDIDRQSGAIAALTTPAGTKLAGRDGPLLAFSHESYDTDDVERFRDSYITNRFDWALYDFGKPGLAAATTARSAPWHTTLVDVAASDKALTFGLSLPDIAQQALGAPKRVELTLRALGETQVGIDLTLYEKPANRLPEAGFLSLTPVATDWEFLKLALWQPASRIAGNAGGNLQAVAAARAQLAGGAGLAIELLDTPLVGPLADFMTYVATPPDFSKGLRFNLYNNKWGTNFPQWWEGDFRARFILTLTS